MSDIQDQVVVTCGEFENVIYYLSKGFYPECMKGQPGLKSNVKRQAQKFTLNGTVLYYKHKRSRKEDTSKTHKLVTSAQFPKPDIVNKNIDF
jgi:hypothetical protein